MDVSKARLREAGQADVEALVEFNARMAVETEGKQLDRARLRRGVAAVLEDPARGFYLVVDAPGEDATPRVVAQLLVTREWSDWRDAEFYWIQSVYVAPEARRQGLYSRLHAEVVNRAREAGACGIRLYVERENAVAQSTYRALGMDRTRYEMFEQSL